MGSVPATCTLGFCFCPPLVRKEGRKAVSGFWIKLLKLVPSSSSSGATSTLSWAKTGSLITFKADELKGERVMGLLVDLCTSEANTY